MPSSPALVGDGKRAEAAEVKRPGGAARGENVLAGGWSGRKDLAAGGGYAGGKGRRIEAIAASGEKYQSSCGLGGES